MKRSSECERKGEEEEKQKTEEEKKGIDKH
jgi:hypothetical protein